MNNEIFQEVAIRDSEGHVFRAKTEKDLLEMMNILVREIKNHSTTNKLDLMGFFYEFIDIEATRNLKKMG